MIQNSRPKITFFRIRLFVYLCLAIAGIYFILNNKIDYFNIPYIAQAKESWCIKHLPKTKTFFRDTANAFRLEDNEKKDFYSDVEKIVPDSEKTNYKNFFAAIQRSSAENFYLIVRFSQIQKSDFKEAMDYWVIRPDNDNASMLVHEFTHLANSKCFYKKTSCKRLESSHDFSKKRGVMDDVYAFNYDIKGDEPYGHYINGQAILYNYDWEMTFPMNYITKNLEAESNFDKKTDIVYSNHVLGNSLDEINAYIISSRTIRQLNCTDVPKRLDRYSYAHDLSRFIYRLSVYLQEAKKREYVWNYIVKNKELAYTIMRLTELGKDEVGIAMINANEKDRLNHDTSPEGVRFNLAALEKNDYIFDELYRDAGISELKGEDLTESELQTYGINFKVIEL